MSIVHRRASSSADLAALLAQCAQFNGRWPERLELYPRFWHRKLRQGRGIGQGPEYCAWIKPREIPSRGSCHTIPGIRSGRLHYALSDWEAVYFHLMERKASTLWICEGWPILDLLGTVRLSAKFGVRHPYRRGFPEAVTIDFLIAERDTAGRVRVRAIAIKSPDDADNPEKVRNLIVQYAWCFEHGLPWALADMSGIRDIRVTLESLKFIRGFFRKGARVPTVSQGQKFAGVFMLCYERNVELEELIARAAQTLRIRSDWAEQLFRFAAWCGDIPVDIQTEIQLNYPLVIERD